MFQLAFAPRMNIKQDEVAFRQNEEKLSKVLDIYEKRLGEARFLVSDEFYLADLSHLPNTQYLVSDTNKGNSFISLVFWLSNQWHFYFPLCNISILERLREIH